MRGRIDISKIKQQREKEAKMQAMGKALESGLLTDMKTQFMEFKGNLEKFAMKYKKQINQDPVFRREFHKMCMEIGVDPISSQKGQLGGALGLGGFYYELGIQVLNVCLALRKKTGGFVEMTDCMMYLRHLRGSMAAQITEYRFATIIDREDICSAIKQLGVFGTSLQIIEVDHKQFISSVPLELNEDHKLLISLGKEQGFISESMARGPPLNLSSQRFQEAIVRF